MNAISDPLVRKVVMVTASQMLKTVIMENAIGYSIHCDPCPMMIVQPDEKNADDFSKDRIGNLIKYTPVIRELVFDSKNGVEDTRSSTFSKRFPGGYLSVASANVEASLSSKSIKRLFMDEVDRYKKKSGKMGDAVTTARARLTTFWDYKEILGSSPGNAGESIIIPEWETTDQCMWYVPCPHCGLYQTLKWGGPGFEFGIKFNKDNSNDVWYECEGCHQPIREQHKKDMNASGQWIAHAPFTNARGFWINALASPWLTWAQLVDEFLKSKDYPEKLQEFVKTRLAEAWEERGESIDDDRLFARREEYAAPVPMGAFVLTSGIDVQADRVECLVEGWGKGFENWKIEHAVFHGDPHQPKVWDELESYLNRTWMHESGSQLMLQSSCIDAGDGNTTHMVYAFCKRMRHRRVFAIVGRAGFGRPVVSAPSKKRTGRESRPVDLYTLGVDSIKEIVYHGLRINTPGPGYVHFPKADWCHEEFFKQLTAEKVVIKTNANGYRERVWKKTRPRNEILDMSGYAYGAIKMLPPNWEDWEHQFVAKPQPKAGGVVQAPPPVRRKRIIHKGYSIDDLLR